MKKGSSFSRSQALPPRRRQGQVQARSIQGDPRSLRDALRPRQEELLRPRPGQPGLQRAGHSELLRRRQEQPLQPDLLPEQVAPAHQVVQLSQARRRPQVRVPVRARV